ASGKLDPLPKPCVDTGMGLERVAATVLNLSDPAKFSNYDTDLFTPLIRRAEELTGAKYGSGPRADPSLRIIADHARAATFLNSDGVMPSNEGRGYVLRKIIRRAADHSKKLGAKQPVLEPMALAVCARMSEAYPELVQFLPFVTKTLAQEEEKYLHLIEPALQRFERRIESSNALQAQSALSVALKHALDALPQLNVPEDTKRALHKAIAEMAQAGLSALKEIEELQSGQAEYASGVTRVLDTGAAAIALLIRQDSQIDEAMKQELLDRFTGLVNAFAAQLSRLTPVVGGADLF